MATLAGLEAQCRRAKALLAQIHGKSAWIAPLSHPLPPPPGSPPKTFSRPV